MHEKLRHLNLRNLGRGGLVFGVGIEDPEADDRGRLLVANDAETLGRNQSHLERSVHRLSHLASWRLPLVEF